MAEGVLHYHFGYFISVQTYGDFISAQTRLHPSATSTTMSHHPSKRSRTAFEREDTSPYLIYGTPFEAPDPKSRDKDAFLPAWKQEVVDERGRKRLHGAFTGGFSAGTLRLTPIHPPRVRWTPSTFTSSRGNRAKITALKPEDFMDEDDLAEAAAEEERKIQREAEAAEAEGTSAEELANRGLTNTATLFNMLSSADEEYALGKKLMQKMGWREGQGVGPKVWRKVRDQDNADGEEEDFKTFWFAPEDVKARRWPHKTDTKGLGYTGELRADDGQEEEVVKPKPAVVKPLKKPNVRLGMGVGVFNDDGEDDDDIYEIKPKSAYNKAIGADKKKKAKAPAGTTPAVKVPGRHIFVSKKESLNRAKLRRCNDGTLPLPGFILADEPLWDDTPKKYPLPDVPEDYIPERMRENPAEYAARKAEQQQPTTLDIKSRGALLGEEQLPGKSVFDFLTPAARERIAAASGQKNLPPALGEQVDTGKTADQKSLDAIPYLEESVAQNALKGFLPYADAPQKRVRYRTFLEIKAGMRQGMPIREPDVSLEDWAKELHEFAHAARIFKPVTGLMANRFTSSSSVASQLPTTGGSKNLETEEVLISRPAAKVEDPAVTAAKMGMYGAMTRSTIRFYPTRLLCKRFNVAPPVHVDSTADDDGGSKDVELVNKRQMDRLMIEANTNSEWRESRSGGREAGTIETGPAPEESMEIDEKIEEKVDINVNPVLEAERAGDEVFKAIFGDDSDEEDD
ncbi:hypothetical protein Dda_3916 [Drechslerella dactyloides]|uniref:G-patch domain-containing protein n=1 Tax=Drechslerella dactyloides TaxID=74499 RepID=A0AAD6NLK3_DREDA|nr:hypothetical protein Dda_3916 [Drechslerella dactyloides]